MSVHEFSYAGFDLFGVDANGCKWILQKFPGWADGLGVRDQRETRSGQDGEWDSTPHRTARDVLLVGIVEAPTHAALELSGREFTGLAKRGEVVGASEGLALSGLAKLDDRGQGYEHTAARVASWSLSLTLPDPLLYGPAVFQSTGLEAAAGGTGRVWPRVWPRDWGIAPGVTPGALTLANAGSATYWPRLRIDGPVVNPVVTNNTTGDFIRYGGTLTAGQWLDIDTGLRRVLLNGQVSVMPRVTYSGAWLGVPTGGADLSWTADTADAAARLSVWSYESAWY